MNDKIDMLLRHDRFNIIDTTALNLRGVGELCCRRIGLGCGAAGLRGCIRQSVMTVAKYSYCKDRVDHQTLNAQARLGESKW